MSGALSELTCLGLHRPGPDAAAAEVATFLFEVASVHDHLAEEDDGGQAMRERALAARFRAAAAASCPGKEATK